MTDKDAELRELRDRLAKIEGGQPRSSVALTTLKVVGVLVALAVGAIVLLAVIGNALPQETDAEKADRLASEINARCNRSATEELADECRMREYLALTPDQLP